MVGKSIKTILVGMVFFIAAGGYLITMVPSGPSTMIKADVVARTSKSGVAGNTGVLICSLENGQRITVDAPAISMVQTGDVVFLNAHDRYLIGPKYSFAGKLIQKES